MKRAIIDTNVLIYAYFEDSREHEKAKRVLSSLETWMIPFISIVELFWFSRGIGLGAKESRDLLLRYLLDKRTKILYSSLENIVDSLVIEDPLDWEDELILLIAEEQGVPIATFDERLKRKAGKRGIPLVSDE